MIKFFKPVFAPIVFALFCLGFVGCNKNQNPPNNNSGTVLIKWSITINGQTRNWQGYYPEVSQAAEGGAQYTSSSGNGILLFVENPNIAFFTFTFAKVGMASAGTYTFNSGSFNATQNSFQINDQANSNIISTQFGGNISLTIQTFPSETISTQISSNTLVKGSFSGVASDMGGTSNNVSGSFEAIRIN